MNGSSLRVLLSVATASAVVLTLSACGSSSNPDTRAAADRADLPHSASPAAPAGSASHEPSTGGSTAKSQHPTHSSTAGKSKPPSQVSVLNSLPGAKTASCVTVGTRSDVRSGPIAMGNFAEQRAAFHKSKGAYDAAQLFFYVIPQTMNAEKVTVQFTPVSSKGKSQTVTSGQVESAGRWKYYPIHVTNPAPGTWRITATAGAEHGCFVVTFTA